MNIWCVERYEFLVLGIICFNYAARNVVNNNKEREKSMNYNQYGILLRLSEALISLIEEFGLFLVVPESGFDSKLLYIEFKNANEVDWSKIIMEKKLIW